MAAILASFSGSSLKLTGIENSDGRDYYLEVGFLFFFIHEFTELSCRELSFREFEYFQKCNIQYLHV